MTEPEQQPETATLDEQEPQSEAIATEPESAPESKQQPEPVTIDAQKPQTEAIAAHPESATEPEPQPEPVTLDEPEPQAEAIAAHPESAPEPESQPEPKLVTVDEQETNPEAIASQQESASKPDSQLEQEPEASQTEAAQPDKTTTKESKQTSLGEVMASDLANSFDLPPETKEWLMETGEAIKKSAKSAWDKFRVKAKDAAISGVNQARTQFQSREAASTAIKLLNSDPEGRLFKGDNYTVTAVNRHTISVTDAEQKEILRFEETALGPKILKSDLTPKQLKEFAQVKGQIDKHGSDMLLGAEPAERMQYLQGFAPLGDRAHVQQIHNERSIAHAENLINTLKPTSSAKGRENLVLGDYEIIRDKDSLQVKQGDRGVILSRTDGKVQGNLSDRDIGQLRGLSHQVDQFRELATQSIDPAAVESQPSQTATATSTATKPQKTQTSQMEVGD
ncbi:MAG: hypothetical protein WCD18_16245 [Thermosynechococcaceae cyanobacterium]